MSLNSIPSDSTQYPVRIILEDLSELTSTSPAEWVLNIATLLIAVAGLVISIIVYSKGKEDAKALNDSSRKLELLKILVLEHNVKVFYDIFQKLNDATDKLKNQYYDSNHRDEVEKAVQSNLRDLNEKVLMLFRAIDAELYSGLLEESDKCRDNIVVSLGDETIELYHPENYKTYILDHINNAKQSMIRIMYHYKG